MNLHVIYWFPSLLNCKKIILPCSFICSPAGIRKNRIPRVTTDQMWLRLRLFFILLSLKHHWVVSHWLNVRIGKLFSQKMGGKGEEREGGKGDLLSNLDANLTISSPCVISTHACDTWWVPCPRRGMVISVLPSPYRMWFSAALEPESV